MVQNVQIKLLSTIAVIAVILGTLHTSDAANILMITYQQPSHVIMKLGIATDLIGRGHQVHFLLAANNPITDTVRQQGIHVVDYQPAPGALYPFTAEFEDVMADLIFNRSLEQVLLSQNLHKDCETTMSDRQLIARLEDLKFDMIVLDPFIVNPCYLLVPRQLGVRYVMAIGIVSPLTLRLPALPSFTGFMAPGGGLVKFPLLQSFAERLINAAAFAVGHNYVLPLLWSDLSVLHKYAPEIESWEEMMLRSEIILVENDHLLGATLPLLPHVVTIAGCTARPPEPLPESLETIMARSGDHGVILASFGTTAHRMPSKYVAKFLAAFGRLRQTVLTKMTVPADTIVPSNVHLVKWLPQNDILGHPKTKLFITHCGSNGQYEALYHGVPMLGIPMFAEQGWNCARAQHKGIARCLDLLTFTADELHDNIMELIENATYRTNVRLLSEIRRDEPMNGCEKAGHWITHVIKYGSEHLRSPALELTMSQFLMFDIIGATVLVVLGIATSAGFAATWLMRIVMSLKHSPHRKTQCDGASFFYCSEDWSKTDKLSRSCCFCCLRRSTTERQPKKFHHTVGLTFSSV